MLHSHANLHSREFDTISVKGAQCYTQQTFKSQREADWQKAQESERKKKKETYQKIYFNSCVRGQLQVEGGKDSEA